MTFDAVVLAGGRARRLGGVSKPEVRVAGRTLLDHALDATAGARRVVVVGPPHLARPGVDAVLEDPPWGGPVAGLAAGLAALEATATGHAAPRPPRAPRAAREAAAAADAAPHADAGSAPHGVADAAPHADADAASRAVPDDIPVLVLACDVPQAAAVVPVLRDALARHPQADGAHLVRDGRAQPVALHRRGPLHAALTGLARGGGLHGASLRALLAGLHMVDVADDAGRSADADTWDDVAHLESVLARRDAMTAQTPADLDRWVAAVAETLGVSADALDRDLLLDLTREVAHTVARPAVPLTTFLMGLAVGAAGGDRAALDAVAAQVAALTAAWAGEDSPA